VDSGSAGDQAAHSLTQWGRAKVSAREMGGPYGEMARLKMTPTPTGIHGAAIYMVTWIPSIYPSHVSIYTSTVDPMGTARWFLSPKRSTLKYGNMTYYDPKLQSIPDVDLIHGYGSSKLQSLVLKHHLEPSGAHDGRWPKRWRVW